MQNEKKRSQRTLSRSHRAVYLKHRSNSFVAIQMHAPAIIVLAEEFILLQPSCEDGELHEPSDSQRRAEPHLRQHPRRTPSQPQNPQPLVEHFL
ncbi:hypothetical protein HKD37_02G003263 [Glycine soja]